MSTVTPQLASQKGDGARKSSAELRFVKVFVAVIIPYTVWSLSHVKAGLTLEEIILGFPGVGNLVFTVLFSVLATTLTALIGFSAHKAVRVVELMGIGGFLLGFPQYELNARIPPIYWQQLEKPPERLVRFVDYQQLDPGTIYAETESGMLYAREWIGAGLFEWRKHDELAPLEYMSPRWTTHSWSYGKAELPDDDLAPRLLWKPKPPGYVVSECAIRRCYEWECQELYYVLLADGSVWMLERSIPMGMVCLAVPVWWAAQSAVVTLLGTIALFIKKPKEGW